MCAQRRLRSTWASAQSDQSLLSAWRTVWSLATHKAHSEDSDQTGRTCHFVGFVMMQLSCLNISNFLKTISRELAKNLSLKRNKNHLLGSTNLLVKTAQFTKQILIIITSVSPFSLHKSVYKCDLNNFMEMFFDHMAPSRLVAIATWYYCLILHKAWWDLGNIRSFWKLRKSCA